MTAPALVCIGNITVDESIAADGAHRNFLGGDAIFAMLAARNILPGTTWLAPLGNDFPAELADELQAAGLSLDQLPRRDLPTVRNVVRYHGDGTRSWELVLGEEHFDRMSVYPEDVPPSYLAADAILVLAMSLGANLALTSWLARRSDAAVYLDLQEDYILGHEQELLGLLPSCTAFLPSEIEAQGLSGTTYMVAAARYFADLGPSIVVVKLGARGCLVLADDTVTELPAAATDVVDVTGAGDAFCGAFAAAHLLTGEPVLAARAATEVAAAAVAGYGVEPLLRGPVHR